MKSYKKILLAVTATLAFGTQAIAADKLRIGTEGAYPPFNLIDASALDSLEAIAERLNIAGVQLHLSEVKGPVMDQLRRSDFLERFGGQVFISQYQALKTLAPELIHGPLEHSHSLTASDRRTP